MQACTQGKTRPGQHNSPSICRQIVTARRPARPGRRPVSRALPLRPLDSATSAGRASSAGSQARVSAQGRCLTASGSAGRSKYTPICASLNRRPPAPRRKHFGIPTPHFAWSCAEFTTNSNYKIPQGSLKLQKVLVVKNTSSKNIILCSIPQRSFLCGKRNAPTFGSKEGSIEHGEQPERAGTVPLFPHRRLLPQTPSTCSDTCSYVCLVARPGVNIGPGQWPTKLRIC